MEGQDVEGAADWLVKIAAAIDKGTNLLRESDTE